jgi:hypothetical protein
MRIWGYILIILNIGAAGAFTYFAAAVLKVRSEWQYALLKQELVNRGFPDAAPVDAPADLEEDSLPLEFTYGASGIDQINKNKLKKIIPQGGDVLGQKTGDPVANQTDEIKRVEKIVFADLEAAKGPAEKRFRLMMLLLNLSNGAGREGVYALLRDYPEPGRLNAARHGVAFLGRSAPQVLALQALSAVAEVNDAFAAKRAPDEIAALARPAQKAIARWVIGEVPNATPDPWVPVNPPPPPSDEPVKNDNRDRLNAAVKPLLDELEKATGNPDPAQVKTAADRIKGLLEGDTAISSAEAKTLILYIASIGGNLLLTPKDVDDAKSKLLELMLDRATTESEKKSLTALADLMIPPDPNLGANATLEDVKAAREKAIAANLDTTALELLRSYFEAAVAKPTAAEKLPDDVGQIRSKLVQSKLLRDAEEKRRRMAHLLYHLDAHLGGAKDRRDEWFKAFLQSKKDDEKEEAFKLPAADAALLENRVKWHQRVAAIVGLQAYIGAAEAQATEFSLLAPMLRTRMIEEQNVFFTEYQAIVEFSIDLAVQVGQRELEVAEQEQLKKAWEDELKKQLTAQKELEEKLAINTAKAKASLDSLNSKVDELFQVTRKLGEAQDALLGLELQIRDLELGKRRK